jgi:glutamate-5-semialdehyde dehydrogenase
MNAPNVFETMQLLGLQARQASRAMARAGTAARNRALRELARLLREQVEPLQAPNQRDLARAQGAGLAEPRAASSWRRCRTSSATSSG